MSRNSSVMVWTLLMLCAASVVSIRAQADSTREELACMRECVPQCLTGSNRDGGLAGNSAQCERKCEQHCAVPKGATLRDVLGGLPRLGDLTGVVAPDFIIICAGAACVCNTADSCNTLIAECPGDFVLQCNQFDDIGQPTGCSCIRVN